MADFFELEDVQRKWRNDPDYCKTYNALFPYEDLAKAIIALRVRHNLTQEMLAERLGRSQPYVARLESGRANVSVNTLRQIAKAVGENLLLIFDGQAAAVGERLHLG